MLNDFFISRDVIGFVSKYIGQSEHDLGDFPEKLRKLSDKQHVSYEQWWRLLEKLNQCMDEPALGVKIGQALTAADCGVLGYLFRTSRNMAEALACYQRFERLLYAGSQVDVERHHDDTLSLSWDPAHGYSSQLSDAVLLSGLVSVARDILNDKRFSPVEVCFAHPVGDDMPTYAEFFQCGVRENQQALLIRFRNEDLHQDIPHRDNVLHRLLGKQAEEQLQQLPENDLFLISLHDTIVRCLHEGKPNADHIASELNVSTRTLHRRLKRKNRVFRDVLRDIRQSMAERYLKDDKLGLSHVALLLGYQDQSAFTRAFKQWFNCSPTQYRKDTTVTG